MQFQRSNSGFIWLRYKVTSPLRHISRSIAAAATVLLLSPLTAYAQSSQPGWFLPSQAAGAAPDRAPHAHQPPPTIRQGHGNISRASPAPERQQFELLAKQRVMRIGNGNARYDPFEISGSLQCSVTPR